MSINNNIENIKKAILFMNEGELIYDFIKNAEIEIESSAEVFRIIYRFTFTTPPVIFKKTEVYHSAFIAKIKKILHEYFKYTDVLITLTADWTKLSNLYTEVKPILTDWDEINALQDTLLEQVQQASTIMSFKNIGNTSRSILQKLSDIVFDPNKHTPWNNEKELGPSFYKNRLWAFMLYKFSDSGTNKEIMKYAISLLDSSDKAIDLSNVATHASHADNFLAQSCAISTITTVHLIKLAYEKKDLYPLITKDQ